MKENDSYKSIPPIWDKGSVVVVVVVVVIVTAYVVQNLYNFVATNIIIFSGENFLVA